MRSQPLPGEASRRRAEEQFKTTKKVNSETKANTPSRQAEAAKTARLRALRLAKEAADKDTANRGAAAAKARRSEEPRRRSKTSGLNPVRTQVRLSGISAHRPDRYAASSAKHGELLRPRPIVSRRSVPSTCAPQTEALPRSAPRRSAPRKSAWYIALADSGAKRL